MSWEQITLGEISKYVQSGGTPSTKKPEYYGGSIPWVKTKEVNFNKIYDTEFKITEKGLEESSAKIIPERSILIAMYGNGDTAGRCAINMIPVSTNQACCNFTFDETKAHPEFMFYLISNHYKDIVHLKSGGAQLNLNGKTLKEFSVFIPPLTTQKKIASILSAYDDLIGNNLKRIKLLEEAAQNIYKEWFVNFRFPGYEEAGIGKDGLPEGWEKKKIFELVTNITDGTHDSPKPTNNGYYLITGKNIMDGFIDFSSAYKISEDDHEKIQKRSYLDNGDVVYSNIGTVGSTGIIDFDFKFSCKNVIIFKPLNKHTYFLYCYLTNPVSKSQFLQGLAGSNQKFISLKYARNYEAILPPTELILQFDHTVKKMFKQKKILNEQNTLLKEARNILLPRLMNRTIEV